ncbi:hypothetical protein SDRG_00381 [Saprolegnia diclina VS20]|uniref:Serine protease n=1 Tax=Saprolegnia diclina (strain VS20) TaxID=1156394 RepID=T0SB73_SAPDV|nr:hypothetical protein SDRG_00381 [Saprolegnia diclina VS20]EQC42653.1 hypothetical protein SDRG_00381 [Saprolegnia diclina VS20]|eukprot:XP_008604076.1 hypothetical protein SDRG_00381 [Saprolegnia diclina VS20]
MQLLVQTCLLALLSVVAATTVGSAGALSPLSLSFDGGAPFRHVIEKPKATYVAVHFESLHIPVNGTLRLVDKSGKDVVTFAGGDHRGSFFAEWLAGDAVTLTYDAPVYKAQSTPVFVIDKVAFGHRAVVTESMCGEDLTRPASCYRNTSMHAPSRAVARLLIQGISKCTGWLIGSEGHLMTNEHCVGIKEDGSEVQVDLGAECDCDDVSQHNVHDACKGTIVATNATFVMSDTANDFALFKLNVKDGVDLSQWGYLQVRASGPVLGEHVYVSGHPNFWSKRVSAYVANNVPGVVTNLSFDMDKGPTPLKSCQKDEFTYNLGTLEGSSGSPVISAKDHVVVGLHNCGSCDAYGNGGIKLNKIVAQLASKGLLPPNAIAKSHC